MTQTAVSSDVSALLYVFIIRWEVERAVTGIKGHNQAKKSGS